MNPRPIPIETEGITVVKRGQNVLTKQGVLSLEMTSKRFETITFSTRKARKRRKARFLKAFFAVFAKFA